MTENILIRSDGPIGHLILNRPEKLNALDEKTADAFVQALDRLEADKALRVIVVSGQGRAFCSGGDLSMLEDFPSLSLEDATLRMRTFYGKFLRLRSVSLPTICSVHGAAVGAGACLMLACDMRVVSDDARIAFNFLKLGLHPGLGASALLPALVGQARAVELLFTARTLHGREAFDLGLAHHHVPKADLERVTRELALELAGQGPQAMRLLKQTMRRWISPERLETALQDEARAQALSYQTDDFREGVAAAREHRKPCFHGR